MYNTKSPFSFKSINCKRQELIKEEQKSLFFLSLSNSSIASNKHEKLFVIILLKKYILFCYIVIPNHRNQTNDILIKIIYILK